jgi:hypothetical protein
MIIVEFFTSKTRTKQTAAETSTLTQAIKAYRVSTFEPLQFLAAKNLSHFQNM